MVQASQQSAVEAKPGQVVVSTGMRPSLIAKFAGKYSIDPDKLMAILKATCFKVKDGEVTNEQMASLLVVADQYGLNPFTREIFAFPDKQNGIVPVVGVDGWSRIINDHVSSDGFEFRQSENMMTPTDGKICPEWMEVVIYRKDRSHPIVVREYLDEVYRVPFVTSSGHKLMSHWQTHTKRALRHKTLIQGARIAYGFSGIYDEDEAERILERDITPQPGQLTDRSGPERLKKALGAGAETSTTVGAEQARSDVEPDKGKTSDAANDAATAQPGATAAPKQPELPPGTGRVKKALLKNLDSDDNDIAVLAWEEVRLYRWTEDEVVEFAKVYGDRNERQRL